MVGTKITRQRMQNWMVSTKITGRKLNGPRGLPLREGDGGGGGGGGVEGHILGLIFRTFSQL